MLERMRTLLLITTLAVAACHTLPTYHPVSIPANVWKLDGAFGYGSAVPIQQHEDRTYFATAAHVIMPGEMQLVFGDTSLPARIDWVSEDNDLAIVSAEILIPVFQHSTRTPQFGEHLLIVGYPLGRPLTASQGLAQQPTRFTGAVAPGNSGGAVLDEHGILIGITVTMEPLPTFHRDHTRFGVSGHYEPLAPLLQQLAELLTAPAQQR